MLNVITRLALFFVLWLPAYSALADVCDDINVLVGYGVIGEDSFDYGNNSEINGNDISGSGNTPTPTGTTETVDLEFPDIDPAVFPPTGGVDLKPPSPPTVLAGSYGTIEFERRNNNPTLTFSGGDYFIDELIIKKGATLQMAPGNYFIDTMTFENSSELIISPAGQVNIYLNSSFQAGNQSEINGFGNTGDLVFYLYDSVSFQIGNGDNGSSNVNFNGTIYSPFSNTSIQMGNNNQITGAILSAGSVDVGNNTEFDFSPAVQDEVIESLGCTPTPSGPDHYRIDHSGVAITCEAEAVIVTAHDNTESVIAPSSMTTITLTTSLANNGWALRAGNGVFTPPNQYTFDGTETAVEFWLTRTTPTSAPHIDIDVSDGTASDPDDGGAEDATLEFRDAALRFYADGIHNSIGPQIAGKNSSVAPGSQTLTLRAVQTNTDTGACEARVTGTQTVSMQYDCVNPNNCKNNNGVTITDASLGVPTAIVDSAPGSNVDLSFDVSGTSAWTLSYADAGQISLSATLDIAASGNDPAVTLAGNSNTFVSSPAGLCVLAPEANSDCASGDANCSAFERAGEDFHLTIQAMDWQAAGETDTDFCAGNNVTPNFELAGLGIVQNLVAPGGGNAGVLGVASVDMTLADDGDLTEANQSISEVGVFTFTVTPPGYFGETIAASTSANVGRIFPYQFALSNMQLIDRIDQSILGCASVFTYMDENLQVTYDLTAQTRLGATTSNYRTNFITPPQHFAKLDTHAELNYSAVDLTGPTNLAGRLTASTPNPNFVGGITSITSTASLDRSGGGPDGPYIVSIGIAPSDDDLVQLNTLDLDTDNDSINDRALIDTTTIHFGRQLISNTHSSELVPATVMMRTEIYDSVSGAFIGNGIDSCTPFDVSAIDLLTATYTAPLSAADLDLSGIGLFSLGVAQFVIHRAGNVALGPGETGDVTYSMAVPAYLQFDWDGDSTLDNPSAKATFGIFSGDSRQIYYRQIFR